MKIRLETKKTTVRLNKTEFQELLINTYLSQETVFPDGNKLSIKLTLGGKQNLGFIKNGLKIVLPHEVIKEHKPQKIGLFFYFNQHTAKEHILVFEVDIKKAPLSRLRNKTN